MSRQARHPKRGFTLIELLVVVAIIALLVSILLPALGRARENTKGAVCSSNLHQLAISSAYYAQENQDRLPYIQGTRVSGTNPPKYKAPYYQYNQLLLFYKYLPDLKIYRCPSARDKNSVQVYAGEAGGLGEHGSYYTVKGSDYNFRGPMKAGYWPGVNPADYPDMPVKPLYTEYYFNDWGGDADFGDPAKTPIPSVSGNLINNIPLPNLAVIMSDAVWEAEIPRHFGANNFAFVDGHVSKYQRLYYLDERPMSDLSQKKDYDGFGNRPFYAWGLSRGVPRTVDGLGY
jgi:prepilin-type N-terminal cleavage/methylation domain-containing protein/prepilin-type processing-associated H-X9-DG protein